MAKKRTYQTGKLDFGRIEFSGSSEKAYVQAQVAKVIKKISSARKAKGWSQEKLAEETATSMTTIRFIENLQRIPSLPMVFKLLYALDRNAEIWP